MSTARLDPAATLLPDGDVLVTGGNAAGGGAALASAELYDPATGKWTTTGSMTDARYGATATVLPDGTVLAAGGCSSCGNQPALSSAEVFNNGFWFPVHSMTQPRVFQTATALPGGSVLVAGRDRGQLVRVGKQLDRGDAAIRDRQRQGRDCPVIRHDQRARASVYLRRFQRHGGAVHAHVGPPGDG